VHGSHLLTEDEMNSAARDYRKILISLRDDIFDQQDMMNCMYLNDLLVINKKS